MGFAFGFAFGFCLWFCLWFCLRFRFWPLPLILAIPALSEPQTNTHADWQARLPAANGNARPIRRRVAEKNVLPKTNRIWRNPKTRKAANPKSGKPEKRKTRKAENPRVPVRKCGRKTRATKAEAKATAESNDEKRKTLGSPAPIPALARRAREDPSYKIVTSRQACSRGHFCSAGSRPVGARDFVAEAVVRPGRFCS